VAWTVRTDAIRISCATHYPASSIEPWAAEAPPANFAALLAGNGGLVAEGNGAGAGFGVVHPQSGESAGLVGRPHLGGRGIGEMLLARMEEMAGSSGAKLLVLYASLNAVPFYRSHGFQPIGAETQHRSSSGVVLPLLPMFKSL